MIQNTLSEIEARIERAESIKPESKAELLNLLSNLKSEVAELSRTHEEQAQSIAGFTAVSTHEATREEKNPELVNLSLQGLASSAEGFEKSHPRLVQVVNSICTTLSNLGI
jgi:prefoldin subunit 5